MGAHIMVTFLAPPPLTTLPPFHLPPWKTCCLRSCGVCWAPACWLVPSPAIPSRQVMHGSSPGAARHTRRGQQGCALWGGAWRLGSTYLPSQALSWCCANALCWKPCSFRWRTVWQDCSPAALILLAWFRSTVRSRATHHPSSLPLHCPCPQIGADRRLLNDPAIQRLQVGPCPQFSTCCARACACLLCTALLQPICQMSADLCLGIGMDLVGPMGPLTAVIGTA